ncbi:TMhelix containing protein [Vibrio phage 2.275.O._10N.286.54.E11]|nr:TMhelix containing protein [Vibrio phage 2.275.O._10N.286.54.E11]
MFGFIDNFLLVLFGEAIDQTISATFGFSTMFSAGLGNTFSDAIGAMGEVFIAGAIIWAFGEAKTEGVSRKFILLASTLGIIVGCLVGLFPLLWL